MSDARQPPPSRWPALILRRSDQLVAAAILAAALAILGAYWIYQEFFGRGLIDIDQAEPQEIQFLVDVNQADWPGGTSGNLLPKSVVFHAADLPKRAFFDHREAPYQDLAAAVIKARLAKGRQYYQDVLAAVERAGASRSSAYKAARRLGVKMSGGMWSVTAAS